VIGPLVDWRLQPRPTTDGWLEEYLFLTGVAIRAPLK
jgi:hypothetical protein